MFSAALDFCRSEAHIFDMTDPNSLTDVDWIAALDRSEAQVSAGETVPAAPILKRLRESIEHLEAKQQVTRRRTATPRR